MHDAPTALALAAILFPLFLGPFALDYATRRVMHKRAIRQRLRDMQRDMQRDSYDRRRLPG